GSDGKVVLTMPYVEMGQGTYTSIPMLIAEELQVSLQQVRLEHAPPNEKLYANPLLGVQATGNSNAMRGAWKPLREAGATARTMLVGAGATRWDVDATSCRAQDGEVVHVPTGGRLKYGELAAQAVKGVRKIIRLDDAVAVVADHMGAAKKGLAVLKIEWDDGPHARLTTADVAHELEQATLGSGAVAQSIGDVDKAMASATTK